MNNNPYGAIIGGCLGGGVALVIGIIVYCRYYVKEKKPDPMHQDALRGAVVLAVRAPEQQITPMHQDALRGPVHAPEQQITPATAANGTHGTLEDADDDLELPEPAFPFEEVFGASHPQGDTFSC